MPPHMATGFAGFEASAPATPIRYVYHNNHAPGSPSHSGFVTSHQESPPPSQARAKIVLIGDGAVGKTSLVVSYTTNGYPTEYVPTAFDNYTVVVTVDNKPVRLQLCDTAGQDDFDRLRPLCYPNTDVFLVCFSVVSPTSFYNVSEKWLPEIHLYDPSASIVLIGTQSDLRNDVKVLIELSEYGEKPVPASDAENLVRRIGAHSYIECSALTEKNMKEVFDSAILVALERKGAIEKGDIGSKREQFSISSNTDYNTTKKRRWKKLCCFSR